MAPLLRGAGCRGPAQVSGPVKPGAKERQGSCLVTLQGSGPAACVAQGMSGKSPGPAQVRLMERPAARLAEGGCAKRLEAVASDVVGRPIGSCTAEEKSSKNSRSVALLLAD